MKKERLLILGASVRAAAQSAAAAGYEVIAADQFADRDLREICPDARPVKYPEGLLDFAMTVEPCAWMYTGALENYPELVERISQRHELLGNGAEVLRRVRDRSELFGFLEQSEVLMPEICWEAPPPSKKWIIKREASGGGLGIRMANPDSQLASGELFQEFLAGDVGSVSFLASEGEAKPLLSSEQFHNQQFLGAPRFHYAGVLTALRGVGLFPREILQQLASLGNPLTKGANLKGVFGIDFIVCEGALYLLEVNPRFTASAASFDRFFQESVVGLHVRASRENYSPPHLIRQPCKAFFASGVLYARDECHITDRMSDRLWAMRGELDLADLPMGGSAIGKGHPVLTIFAEGNSREETMRSLEAKANQLRALGIP